MLFLRFIIICYKRITVILYRVTPPLPKKKTEPINFFITSTKIKQNNSSPGYDVKLHLVAKYQLWSSGECGVPLHCHYSQVHSDREW